jgi:NADH:ubiquinone oxidoreductase subunit 2 (subunit N)
MLAYSTISHIAFILLAIISAYSPSNLIFATQSSIFYVVKYSFSGMAIFAILLGLITVNDDITIDNLRGFAKKLTNISGKNNNMFYP